LLRQSVDPNALATAFPTAQTFYEGYDRGVRLDAASNKLWFCQTADVAAAEAFDPYSRHR